MNPIRSLLAAALLLPALASAAPLCETADCVLVTRGGAKVTVGDIDAKVQALDPAVRANVMIAPKRVEQAVEGVLLNRQLADRARAEGYDKDPQIQEAMRIAAEEFLAKSWLDKTVRETKAPDFAVLAKETYTVNPQQFMAPDTRIVRHLLVATKDRKKEEARKLAEDYLAQAKAGANFDKLIQDHSDDPGKTSNQGRYTVDEPEKYEPAFEHTAMAMTKVGEFSGVFETSYGYHFMKLESYSPAKPRSFDEVKDELIAQLTEQFKQSAREKLLSDLRSEPTSGDQEALFALRTRYLPEAERVKLRAEWAAEDAAREAAAKQQQNTPKTN